MQIGIFGLLTIIFVIAKLAGWIAWSWLWVLAPLWIGFLALLGILLGLAALAIWAQR
jgi:hypothetical protein